MAAAIAAAGLGVLGMGASWYGAQQQQDAMRDAQNRYGQNLSAFYGRQQNLNREMTDRYRGLEDERMGAVGRTLDDFMAPSYQSQAGDTATIDSALSRVRANGGPATPQGGAAGNWAGASGMADRNSGAISRTRAAAGDANMIGRHRLDQNKALGDFRIADTQIRRRVGDVGQEDQLRRAQLARQMQELEQLAQLDYQHAEGRGSDWMMVGGALGGASSLTGAMSAGSGSGQRRPGATGQSPGWQGGMDPANAPVGYDPYYVR